MRSGFLKGFSGNPPSRDASCALSGKPIGATPTATTKIATFNKIKLCLAKMRHLLRLSVFSFSFLAFLK